MGGIVDSIEIERSLEQKLTDVRLDRRFTPTRFTIGKPPHYIVYGHTPPTITMGPPDSRTFSKAQGPATRCQVASTGAIAHHLCEP